MAVAKENKLVRGQDLYYVGQRIKENFAAKEDGKGLSTNDYTTDEKTKLAGIESGAQKNVKPDWNAASGDAQILNKPSIPTKTSDLTNDSGFITSGDIPAGVQPATVAPKMDGAAAIGSSAKYAKEDHVHPSDSSKADKATTLAGYGITNAYTKAEVDTAISNKQDTIADLPAIRSGAALGETSVQPADIENMVEAEPIGSIIPPVNPSEFATKEEVSQLEHEVHNLSGKYYGIFESANDLPEGDANGYAFVGVEEPFLIYNCVNGVWSNTQAIANCFIGTTIDDVSININNQVGTPSGAASIIGKTLNIDLYNLKGDKGDDGEQGVPGPQGPEGPQGNSGYQGAAGELELVNNLSDGGGTKALSAEMGKQLNIVKPGISEGTTGDLEVADENGNAIVIFKDGGIQTKNFDSEKSLSTNLPSVPDNDLEIKDENNFAIVIFKNGGIKTKNFDSSEITNEISSKLSTYHYYATRPKVLLFDYGFATEISPDFATNSNWSISGGKLVSSSAGIGNRLQNNLHITVSQKRTYCRFAIGADTYFAIGWLSSAFAYDGSIFSVNASDSVFAIHANWTTAGTLPSVLLSKSYAFVSGREYEIVIEKDGHINRMWIVDCLTGATSDVLETQQTATSGAGEFVGGRQMDRLMIIHISGISPQISYVRSVSKYKEPLAVVYGDSITEGDRVYNGQTYVDHLKNLYGDERIMCSGLSGSVISNVIDRMNAELPLLKPKFVIVAIGTNGSNTQQLFNNAKQVILDNGAIPIFCVPPMGFSGLDYVRGYILNLNVTTVRFDIATAINNDIAQGKNTSLFADTYHPNANGHLAMYRRLLADCQILNNY